MSGELPPGIFQQFGLQPQSVQLLKAERDGRAVWRVADSSGTYALKRFHKAKRAMSAALVTRHMMARGVPVAPVVAAADGSFWVVYDDCSYALFRWVEGEHPSYATPGMIEAIATLLARFHVESAGHSLPAQSVTRFLNWQAWYRKQAGLLARLEAQAAARCDALSDLLRPHGPWLRRRAEWAIANLEQPEFYELLHQAGQAMLLAHRDYSRDNLLLPPGGDLVIIDLDTVAVSHPFWDLMRLITWIDHDRQNWSAERMHSVLDAYSQVRPVSTVEKDLLLVDHVFPRQAVSIARHWYEGTARPSLPEEFERCLATDRARLSDLGVGPN